MNDATCFRCQYRFGWHGRMVDRPPCPKCGAVVAIVELTAVDKQLEKDEAESPDRTRNPENRRTIEGDPITNRHDLGGEA